MTHSIEIVPLHCTETGLRLRTKFKAATEYDVVARRVAKGKNEFLWRKPAETIEEARRIAAEAQDDFGADAMVIGDLPHRPAAPLRAAPPADNRAALSL
ncbi:hypothetical protein [Limimaricola cinnabarinus]|jgi:hypothetical protein|uniref:Uncharacterized protein n=1 Tax=Limimaricola cinnabarinus LL-001 TaxID=1337093 RepID=U3AG63_9RHOB|nr:hypothetical protein [Limimaricola cinnabarinus]GAD56684.1 hypothetical protein MBELCI_2736 [Limimaricola cinnabarinus LL-001]